MEEGDAGASEPSAMVVVPRRPGPLIVPPRDERRRDDLDEVLDELFGPPTKEGPGPLDVVLVVGGLLLGAASLLGWLPSGVGALGAVAAALGLVLPVRSLWQRLARRRAVRRLRGTLDQGLPLDLGHDVVRRPATDRPGRPLSADRRPVAARSRGQVRASCTADQASTRPWPVARS